MLKKLKALSSKTLEYRNLLRSALRFNNTQLISEYSFNLAIINSQIADIVIDALERIEKTDANNVIGSSIAGNVEVKEYTPVDFDSVNRDGSKEIVFDPDAPIIS